MAGMRDPWNPARYDRFVRERSAPLHDLLALVRPIPGGRAVDLGCGTGALTLELHQHVRAGETVGIDSSPAMLEQAGPLAGNGLRFERGDIGEFAGEEPFRSGLGGYRRLVPVEPPERYAELLDRLGFAEQHVRLQVYGHHLAGREEVVEWVRGTLLTDYQRRMPAELFERFLASYRERLLPLLEERRPYFYPFKRLLLWGGMPR